MTRKLIIPFLLAGTALGLAGCGYSPGPLALASGLAARAEPLAASPIREAPSASVEPVAASAGMAEPPASVEPVALGASAEPVPTA
jgi:hypothetical protein